MKTEILLNYEKVWKDGNLKLLKLKYGKYYKDENLN